MPARSDHSSDNTGTVIGTNLTLDARGEPAATKLSRLDTSVSHKIDCVASADANIWGPIDNVGPNAPFGSTPTWPITTAEANAGLIATDIINTYEVGNVLRYGALADNGTTDNATAFSRALSVGAYVTVPDPGPTAYFDVTSEIAFPAGRMITGLEFKPRIKFTGSMAAANLFSLASGGTGFHLYNLQLEGDVTADGNATNGAAVHASNCTDVDVRGCRIKNFPQAGLILNQCTAPHAIKNEIYCITPFSTAAGGVAGISLEDDSTRALIQSNDIHDIGFTTGAGSSGHGIRIIAQNVGNSAPTRTRCLHNRVEEIQMHGILYYDNANAAGTDAIDAAIIGNTVRRTGLASVASNERGSGIYVKDISNISVICNETIDDNVNTTGSALLRAGIVVYSVLTQTCANVEVLGNTCRNGTRYGIALQNILTCIIDGNIIDGPAVVGMRISGDNCADIRIGSMNVIKTANTIPAFEHACTTSVRCTADIVSAVDRSGHTHPFITNSQAGCRVIVYGEAIPTVSNWQVGDRVLNRAPTAGEPYAWVNTVAGGPGMFEVESRCPLIEAAHCQAIKIL